MEMSRLVIGLIVGTLLHPTVAPSTIFVSSSVSISSSKPKSSPPTSIHTQPSSIVDQTMATDEKTKKHRGGGLFFASRKRVTNAEEAVANADVRLQNLTDKINNHAEMLERQVNVDEKFRDEVDALRLELDNLVANIASKNDSTDEKYRALCAMVDNAERKHSDLSLQVPIQPPLPALPDPNAATKQELQELSEKLEENIANLKIQARSDPDAEALLHKIREEMKLRERESKTRDEELQNSSNKLSQSLSDTKTDLATSKSEAAKTVAELQRQLSNMQQKVVALTQRCECAEKKVAEANATAVNAGATADNATTIASNAASTANEASLTANAASTAASKAAAASKATEAARKPVVRDVHTRPMKNRNNRPVTNIRPRVVELPRHRVTRSTLNDFFQVIHHLSEEYAVVPAPLPSQFCTTRNQKRLRQIYSMVEEEVEELDNLCDFFNILPLPQRKQPPQQAQHRASPAEKVALNQARAIADRALAARILIKLIDYAHVAFNQMWFWEKALNRELDKKMTSNRAAIKYNNRAVDDIVRVPLLIMDDNYD